GGRSLACVSSCHCHLHLDLLGNAIHHVAGAQHGNVDSEPIATGRSWIIFRCRPHPRSDDSGAWHHPALTSLFLRARMLPRYLQTSVKVHTLPCWYVPVDSSLDLA